MGQSHEIEIPLTPDYRRRFDAAHARLYGHASPTRPVEVLGLRVTVSERDVVSRPRRPARRRAAPPPHALEDVVWHGRRVRVARYARDLLPPGTVLRGPALLLEYSSTILVAPGWRAVVDAESNLRLTR